MLAICCKAATNTKHRPKKTADNAANNGFHQLRLIGKCNMALPKSRLCSRRLKVIVVMLLLRCGCCRLLTKNNGKHKPFIIQKRHTQSFRWHAYKLRKNKEGTQTHARQVAHFKLEKYCAKNSTAAHKEPLHMAIHCQCKYLFGTERKCQNQLIFTSHSRTAPHTQRTHASL